VREEPFPEMNVSGHRPLEERAGLLAAIDMVERSKADNGVRRRRVVGARLP
jgi:hypothetical protein